MGGRTKVIIERRIEGSMEGRKDTRELGQMS
jgi:hypothetical protein